MIETCKCPNGCGVDLIYQGDREWVCPICKYIFDLEDVDVDNFEDDEIFEMYEVTEIWKQFFGSSG